MFIKNAGVQMSAPAFCKEMTMCVLPYNNFLCNCCSLDDVDAGALHLDFVDVDAAEYGLSVDVEDCYFAFYAFEDDVAVVTVNLDVGSGDFTCRRRHVVVVFLGLVAIVTLRIVGLAIVGVGSWSWVRVRVWLWLRVGIRIWIRLRVGIWIRIWLRLGFGFRLGFFDGDFECCRLALVLDCNCL